MSQRLIGYYLCFMIYDLWFMRFECTHCLEPCNNQMDYQGWCPNYWYHQTIPCHWVNWALKSSIDYVGFYSQRAIHWSQKPKKMPHVLVRQHFAGTISAGMAHSVCADPRVYSSELDLTRQSLRARTSLACHQASAKPYQISKHLLSWHLTIVLGLRCTVTRSREMSGLSGLKYGVDIPKTLENTLLYCTHCSSQESWIQELWLPSYGHHQGCHLVSQSTMM